MRHGFEEAWRRLGAGHVPEFAAIAACYSEPHRAYHTLEHLRDCLEWLAVSQQLAQRPLEVKLALVYHDAVYVPQRSDNEVRSAELFRAHARASRLADGPTERIAALIEGTALHRAQNKDGALLNDIDLAVLGSSPHRFARYERQIREEYGHVDQRLFHAGRERILRAFLEAAAIYETSFFSQRLEAQAHGNLSRALLTLQNAGRVEQL